MVYLSVHLMNGFWLQHLQTKLSICLIYESCQWLCILSLATHLWTFIFRPFGHFLHKLMDIIFKEVVISGGTSTPHILLTLEIPDSLADHTRVLQLGGFVIENACRKSSWIKVKMDNKYDGIWTLWFLFF